MSPSPIVLPSAAVADAIGNRDGALTGIEVRVAKASSALPAGARCWLGVDWRPEKGMSNAPLDRVLDAVCGLDCGDGHLGLGPGDGPIFVRVCPAAIPLSATADGFRPDELMVVDGRASPFRLAGQIPETGAAPRPIEAVAAELAASDDQCAGEVRTSGSGWAKALGAGQCLPDRLGRWQTLGDSHRDPPRCGWPLAMLDLAGARRCDAGGEQLARQLFSVFESGALPTAAGRVDLPMDELVGDQGLPGRAADTTRIIDWGRRLQAQKALDARGRAGLVNAMAAVPLGLVDAEVGALLADGVEVRSLEDGILIWLAQRDRLTEIAPGYRPLSPRAKSSMTQRVSEQCARRIESAVGEGG